MDKLNERVVDRMVDGELTDDETADLLHACEDNPSRWRALALAYVESQTWRSEFSQLREQVDRQPNLLLACQPDPPRASRWRLTPSRTLNIAAMLLLSLAIGYGVGAILTDSVDDRHQLAKDESRGKGSPNPAEEQIVVLVQDQQTKGFQSLQVPLVSIADITPDGLAQHHQLPRDLWKSLQDSGHEVAHQRQWYPVRLRDGRNALVPVDDLRVDLVGFQ